MKIYLMSLATKMAVKIGIMLTNLSSQSYYKANQYKTFGEKNPHTY